MSICRNNSDNLRAIDELNAWLCDQNSHAKPTCINIVPVDHSSPTLYI